MLTTKVDAAKSHCPTANSLWAVAQLSGHGIERRRALRIAIVGDENQLRGQIKRFEDMGVSDFNAAIMNVEDGAYERTLNFSAVSRALNSASVMGGGGSLAGSSFA